MGVVLAFPVHRIRTDSKHSASAQIVILPVIRYERHDNVGRPLRHGGKPTSRPIKRRGRKA